MTCEDCRCVMGKSSCICTASEAIAMLFHILHCKPCKSIQNRLGSYMNEEEARIMHRKVMALVEFDPECPDYIEEVGRTFVI